MGSSAALWLNRRELGTCSARHWLRLAPRQPAFTAPQYGTEPLGLSAGQQHAYRSQGQLPLRHLTFLHNTYRRPTCLLNVFTSVYASVKAFSLQPSAISLSRASCPLWCQKKPPQRLFSRGPTPSNGQRAAMAYLLHSIYACSDMCLHSPSLNCHSAITSSQTHAMQHRPVSILMASAHGLPTDDL
jgi:hypothetical protein